ncbi:DUF397 domain-containing protein [Streptomyces sp. IB2014 016-6]|nr:DUF397 domain-containing protein [Streptomyces sp. IB2014 016-6]
MWSAGRTSRSHEDSKTPHGPVLAFDASGWGSFISAVKRGALGA